MNAPSQPEASHMSNFSVKVKLSRADYEREIGDFAEPGGNELKVRQITPYYGTPANAVLPVRDARWARMRVRKIHAGLSYGCQGFFHLRAHDELGGSRFGLVAGEAVPPDRLIVMIGHLSDRIGAGYENIYRAIRSLAPYLDPCRFVLKEHYANWVDEYRVEATGPWGIGELHFERGFAKDVCINHLHDYLFEEAVQRSQDRDWARLVVREVLAHADFSLSQARSKLKYQLSSGAEILWYLVGARTALKRLDELAPGEPLVQERNVWLADLENHLWNTWVYAR
jgi:hypothetical protein